MLRQKPREIAFAVLTEREAGQDYVEDLLAAALDSAALTPADRGLLQELVCGVARWQATLDWLIRRKTADRPQKAALTILLRLGLYQLFWLDRIPDHAAVNEAVDLARQQGYGAQAGFVNAVLRGFARDKEETRQLLNRLRSEDPSLGYSHPAWLVDRWRGRWGSTQTARLLAWNNTPPKTYARVNTLRTDPGRLITRWREEGVEYDLPRWEWVPENLVFELKSHPPLGRLESFQQGWFYVQDPSTLLAVFELAPLPGDQVLDYCAAPGGKATFAAQLMENNGAILAQDASAARLRLVTENCARLGTTCVTPVLALSESPEPQSSPGAGALFGRVLLDVPCSNTGVMRRRVDLRWRLQPREIARLRSQQSQLLGEAAARLAPGGTLVYSTCSLEPEENQQVIREFLSNAPAFRLERERELLPFQDGADGAYVARLTRLT